MGVLLATDPPWSRRSLADGYEGRPWNNKSPPRRRDLPEAHVACNVPERPAGVSACQALQPSDFRLDADGLVTLCSGRRIAEQRARRAVLGEEQLEIADVALGERGFAVRKVQIPHANEPIVVAEVADLVEVRPEAIPPGMQC